MAAAIYVSTALSDYIEIGSNTTTTTTTTTCAGHVHVPLVLVCREKNKKKKQKPITFSPGGGEWRDLGDVTFGLLLFADRVYFPIRPVRKHLNVF